MDKQQKVSDSKESQMDPYELMDVFKKRAYALVGEFNLHPAFAAELFANVSLSLKDQARAMCEDRRMREALGDAKPAAEGAKAKVEKSL